MFLIALIFSCFFVFHLFELFFTLADFYNYFIEENMFVINMFAYIVFNIDGCFFKFSVGNIDCLSIKIVFHVSVILSLFDNSIIAYSLAFVKHFFKVGEVFSSPTKGYYCLIVKYGLPLIYSLVSFSASTRAESRREIR